MCDLFSWGDCMSIFRIEKLAVCFLVLVFQGCETDVRTGASSLSVSGATSCATQGGGDENICTEGVGANACATQDIKRQSCVASCPSGQVIHQTTTPTWVDGPPVEKQAQTRVAEECVVFESGSTASVTCGYYSTHPSMTGTIFYVSDTKRSQLKGENAVKVIPGPDFKITTSFSCNIQGPPPPIPTPTHTPPPPTPRPEEWVASGRRLQDGSFDKGGYLIRETTGGTGYEYQDKDGTWKSWCPKTTNVNPQ